MTIPGPELQQRIRRIEHGLSQVGTLLVPVEISDGVKKAITLSNIDPDMALGRARKVLDFIIADLYKREFGRPPGTQPLENSVQQLAKAGKLPRTMVAYANSVRELGNVGIHGSGEAITEEDVVSSLENLMRLVAWYCEQVRPGGEDKIEPEPPPIEDDNIAEKERAEKERAEKERAEKERAEKERADKERIEKERAEKERAEKERAEKERAEKELAEKERAEKERAEKERLEKEKEKQQKKPPRPSRKPIVVVLLAACVLGGALWWWLEASPAARHKAFLKHKYDGIALLKNGNYADARMELLSAYSFDPNDDYVYFCLGEAEYHLGNLRYAIDYYQRSLKLKPDASYAQIGLANALLQSGDVDGAIAEYKVILRANYSFALDPATLAQVHTKYGAALLKKGDINGSSEQFGLAVKANPGWRSQLGDRIKVSPQTH
jgi:TolA-binding protein